MAKTRENPTIMLILTTDAQSVLFASDSRAIIFYLLIFSHPQTVSNQNLLFIGTGIISPTVISHYRCCWGRSTKSRYYHSIGLSIYLCGIVYSWFFISSIAVSCSFIPFCNQSHSSTSDIIANIQILMDAYKRGNLHLPHTRYHTPF